MITPKFKVLIKTDFVNDEMVLPEYATEGSSGMDLQANYTDIVRIPAMERRIFSTGIFVALPDEFEFQIRSKSGLAAKEGLMVLNSPGTVDSDYRGEILIVLFNSDTIHKLIEPGQKIAQAILAHVPKVRWNVVVGRDLPDTVRGAGGFGSTGV